MNTIFIICLLLIGIIIYWIFCAYVSVFIENKLGINEVITYLFLGLILPLLIIGLWSLSTPQVYLETTVPVHNVLTAREKIIRDSIADGTDPVVALREYDTSLK